MVHIMKSERNAILYNLLKDGVICVKKEFEGPHPDLQIDNLKVWMVTRSLHSKDFLGLTFSWRHYYYTLNPDGIVYIKKVLGIDDETVQPGTHKTRNDPVENQQRRRPRRGRDGMTRGRRGAPRGRDSDNAKEGQTTE